MALCRTCVFVFQQIKLKDQAQPNIIDLQLLKTPILRLK